MFTIKEGNVIIVIYRTALLWEIFSIIVCINCLHNRKVKFDIITVILFMVIMGILELLKFMDLNNVSSLFIYGIIIFYCMLEFKDCFGDSIICTLLMMIIIGIMQFITFLPFTSLDSQYEELRMLLVNMVVGIFSMLFLSKIKIYKLYELIKRKEKFILLIFYVMFLVILFMIVGWKFDGKLNVVIFIFVIPSFVFLLLLIIKWKTTSDEKELVKNELKIVKSTQEDYSDLLTSVRLRQHGFRNHLTALLSIRYTIKSYDELIKAQDEYFNKINIENNNNKLLNIGDSIICGFLYKKFCQAEVNKISVSYEIKGVFNESEMPVYHLIEVLGIIIDNAVEAQTDIEKKRILFKFYESDIKYYFTIMNPYPHVSYAEIESWFNKNSTTKGKEHGLGLFFVKKICKEHNAYVLCRNREYLQENWIEMTLEIKKADKE